MTDPTLTVSPNGVRSWTVIGDPPADGRDWDDQCARCGSSVARERCEWCGGEMGDWDVDYSDPAGEEEWVTCPQCGGSGSWSLCLSSEDYCRDHPMPGREDVARGQVEWFTFDEPREVRA